VIKSTKSSSMSLSPDHKL